MLRHMLSKTLFVSVLSDAPSVRMCPRICNLCTAIVQRSAKIPFLGCVTRPHAQRRITQPRKSILADLCNVFNSIFNLCLHMKPGVLSVKQLIMKHESSFEKKILSHYLIFMRSNLYRIELVPSPKSPQSRFRKVRELVPFVL